METAINYWWTLPILIILLALVGWTIRRNAKDVNDFEKDFTRSEFKTRKHGRHQDEV